MIKSECDKCQKRIEPNGVYYTFDCEHIIHKECEEVCNSTNSVVCPKCGTSKSASNV